MGGELNFGAGPGDVIAVLNPPAVKAPEILGVPENVLVLSRALRLGESVRH